MGGNGTTVKKTKLDDWGDQDGTEGSGGNCGANPDGDVEDDEERHMNCMKTPYSQRIASYVKIVYIIMAVIWTFIIICFQLYDIDFIGFLILTIPYLVYGFGYFTSDYLCREVEVALFTSNYLAVGLLVILPLISWVSRDYGGESYEHALRFKTILVLAVILIMLTMLDIWVPRNWLSVYKHVKSSIQTMAVGLLIYGFYCYYLMCHEHYLLEV